MDGYVGLVFTTSLLNINIFNYMVKILFLSFKKINE